MISSWQSITFGFHNHDATVGVANGKMRDSLRLRDPSQKSVSETLGKKFQDSKKVKTDHAKTRLRDLSKTLPRFRDPVKIFQDPRFSRYHSPPLTVPVQVRNFESHYSLLKYVIYFFFSM